MCENDSFYGFLIKSFESKIEINVILLLEYEFSKF